MFITRVDFIACYMVFGNLGPLLWFSSLTTITVVFVACNRRLKNTYSLRSSARAATKNHAIAVWHCLLMSTLVKVESNTLNDKNLQKVSLVVSLLRASQGF